MCINFHYKAPPFIVYIKHIIAQNQQSNFFSADFLILICLFTLSEDLLEVRSREDTTHENYDSASDSPEGEHACVSENNNGEYIPLKDIAERQEISKKYLEIIVKDMVTGGLIHGASGKGGGYKLVKKPEKYTVGEILELMEGTLASVACLTGNAQPCPRENICRTLPMWKGLNKVINEYLDGITIGDLAASMQPGDYYVI